MAVAAPAASPELDAPKPPPSHRREHFRCPACGRTFSRNVRVGLFSKCPRCGHRAYGVAVLEDIARAQLLPPEPKPAKPRRKRAPAPAPPPVVNGRRPSSVGSFPAEPGGKKRAPAIPPPPNDRSQPPAPTSAPAPPPAPAAGLFSRLFGRPAEDD
jgi:hypothetical protein